MKLLNAHILRFVLCAFFCLVGWQNIQAQSNVGVIWEPSVDDISFEERLSFFDEHHISILIIQGELNTAQQSLLAQYNLPFLIDLDYRFLSQSTAQSELTEVKTKIENWTEQTDSNSVFNGVIAFKHSLISSESFDTQYPYFVQKKDSLIDENNGLQGLFFNQTEPNVKSLHSFVEKLESNSPLIIVELDWLDAVFEEYPSFKDSFTSAEELKASTIPLPLQEISRPIIHWSILVLLILWISLAIHVKVNPTYYETIPRYFTAHRFFVDDILSYRERSSLSGIFLLFQHALFGGLVTYVLARSFVSEIGLEALYTHLPYLQILGANYFSLFFLGSLLVLVVEMIALIWLYFPNAQLTHFNQALNLFTWIFHLDFIFVTLLITLFFAKVSPTWFVILGLIYVIIWFASFNITAWNASKKLGMKRTNYLLKTIVLHTILSAAGFIMLVLFQDFWTLLELITSV